MGSREVSGVVGWRSRGVDPEDIDNIHKFWILMKCNVPEEGLGVVNVNLSIDFQNQ